MSTILSRLSSSSAPGSLIPIISQVGGNLCDHLLLATMNVSKVPMAETDYSENGNHGMAYFSFGLPRPETSDSIADDGNGGDAVSTPRTSAVLGFMHNDGGTAYLIPLILRMMFTEPGFLATLMREAIAALVWILLRFTPLGWLLRRTRGTVVLLTTVKSRGTVRLASKDPAAPPLIDPAYLTHPEDRQAMCAALHAVRRARTETPTSKAVLGYDLAPGKTCVGCECWLLFSGAWRRCRDCPAASAYTSVGEPCICKGTRAFDGLIWNARNRCTR